MNHHEHENLRALLKQSITPENSEPNRDLWPAMLRRLDEHSSAVPWFDWALLAIVALCLVLVPGAIPVLLYHL